MIWDITTPVGSENKTLGAQRIREGKEAQENALATEGIFPGATPSSPVYIPTIGYGPESSRPAANADLAGRWFYNTTTGSIQRDTGTAWENVTAPITIIPSGTKMVFFEAAAPTGWTQVTSGIGDRLIRLASTGGVAVAGDSVSSPATHAHDTGAASGASHTHTNSFSMASSLNDTDINNTRLQSVSSPSGSTDLPHVHSLTAAVAFTPKYLDVIICTKD